MKFLLYVHGGRRFPPVGLIVVTVTEEFQAPVPAYVSNKLCLLISVWTYLIASYYQTGCNVVDFSSKAECPSHYVLCPLSKWFILYLKRNLQQRQQDNPEICDEKKLFKREKTKREELWDFWKESMRNNVTGLEWDGLRIQQINEERNNMAVEHNTK